MEKSVGLDNWVLYMTPPFLEGQGPKDPGKNRRKLEFCITC